MFDVIIVGGGPAGLSAALVLGRCRRRVLVCDAGQPRNAASHAMHGFLSRDGINPCAFLETARQQLEPYSTVETRHVEVVHIEVVHIEAEPAGKFTVRVKDGSSLTSRKLLLASGIVDDIPDIVGLSPLYGRSVHHCPYCDGFEWRDQPLAIYGRGESGRDLALEMMLWSRDLVVCTDGEVLSGPDKELLSHHQIEVREAKIGRLKGSEGKLEEVVFVTGERMARKALFFAAGQQQPSELAKNLGCCLNEDHEIEVGPNGETATPGLYVAGDASFDVQLVVLAAAEGAKAACALNKELMREERTTGRV